MFILFVPAVCISNLLFFFFFFFFKSLSYEMSFWKIAEAPKLLALFWGLRVSLWEGPFLPFFIFLRGKTHVECPQGLRGAAFFCFLKKKIRISNLGKIKIWKLIAIQINVIRNRVVLIESIIVVVVCYLFRRRRGRVHTAKEEAKKKKKKNGRRTFERTGEGERGVRKR